jgi:hypothetical protein
VGKHKSKTTFKVIPKRLLMVKLEDNTFKNNKETATNSKKEIAN